MHSVCDTFLKNYVMTNSQGKYIDKEREEHNVSVSGFWKELHGLSMRREHETNVKPQPTQLTPMTVYSLQQQCTTTQLELRLARLRLRAALARGAVLPRFRGPDRSIPPHCLRFVLIFRPPGQ